MKKIVFISSVFAFGFTVGYEVNSRMIDEVFSQSRKRAEGDYSYNEKSFISRLAKSAVDEVEVQRFSAFLDKLR